MYKKQTYICTYVAFIFTFIAIFRSRTSKTLQGFHLLVDLFFLLSFFHIFNPSTYLHPKSVNTTLFPYREIYLLRFLCSILCSNIKNIHNIFVRYRRISRDVSGILNILLYLNGKLKLNLK